MSIEKSDIPIPIGPEELQYRGKLFDLITQKMLIGSQEVNFERVRRPPGVRLIITSSNGNILLTREFRTEANSWDYRLHGGKVFDSIDDYVLTLQSGQEIAALAEAAVRKEAQEETGIYPTQLNHLHTSVCGATVDWDLYYFTAHVPTEEIGEQKLEPGENIQVGWYPPEEVLDYLLEGKISEDRTAAVLFRYLSKLKALNLAVEDVEKHTGVGLTRLVEAAKLDSIRVRAENLSRLKEIGAVFIVGSSFTGKSTLVDEIRKAVSEDPQEFESISITKRIITRPQRQNDNLVENSFATVEEFTNMIVNGEIGMHWIRKMEGARTEIWFFSTLRRHFTRILSKQCHC